jgi:hypothetical protein
VQGRAPHPVELLAAAYGLVELDSTIAGRR